MIILILGSLSVGQAQVSPEMELGAKGVMSGNIAVDDAGTSSAVSDFSDSQLLLGFKQKLYNRWRAQMVFGMQFPDADSELGQVFYNHVFLKVMDKSNNIKLGRSTTQTILNEFPTLRDDDALQFIYSLNPFSDGRNTQDNQYGNVIEYDHIFKQRYWMKLHGENFVNASAPENFELNSFGVSLLYDVPESQRWNREIIQRVGLSYNNYIVDQTAGTGGDELLGNLLAAITLNVKPDPVHFIDLKMQGILNSGFADYDSIRSYSEYVKTPSMAGFGTIRYLYRELERPLVQIAVGMGYKWFPILEETSQLMAISNVFYRIGENIDLGVQYRYKRNMGMTEALFGSREHRIQVALVFSVDQIFNSQFDDRDSILNLEYKYIE